MFTAFAPFLEVNKFNFPIKHVRINTAVEPVMHTFNTRVLGLFPTPKSGPMRDFVSTMSAVEDHRRGGAVLSVSLAHDHP